MNIAAASHPVRLAIRPPRRAPAGPGAGAAADRCTPVVRAPRAAADAGRFGGAPRTPADEHDDQGGPSTPSSDATCSTALCVSRQASSFRPMGCSSGTDPRQSQDRVVEKCLIAVAQQPLTRLARARWIFLGVEDARHPLGERRRQHRNRHQAAATTSAAIPWTHPPDLIEEDHEHRDQPERAVHGSC